MHDILLPTNIVVLQQNNCL